MSDTPVVSGVFDIDYERPSADHLKAVRASACMMGLAGRVGPSVPVQYWASAVTNVLTALQRALGSPLTQILADGWNHYRPFVKYCDSKRYPPDAIVQETLLEHTINAQLRPKVRVLLDQVEVGEVNFEATITLKLAGGILTIQSGRFRKLQPGKCWVTATLKCEDAQLSEIKSREFRLPGELSFGEGIPIVPGTAREPATR
jgi:hypothetical protein